MVQDIFNEHGKRDYFELNPDIKFTTAYDIWLLNWNPSVEQ